MPAIETLVIFIAAVISLQILPGPDMMLVLGRGIGQGTRTALATAVGIATAGLIQLPLLALGLASLVAQEPWAMDAVRVLGAAYLIYLGAKLFRSSPVSEIAEQEGSVSLGRAVFDGALTNLLNPKIIVFQLAFIPQFVDVSAGPIWSQMLVLGIVMKCCGFAIMSIVALASGNVGHWMKQRPGWQALQSKLTGLILIGLGLRLIFELRAEHR